MHQDVEAKLTSQISTTEITSPGEHDYQSPSSKLSNIRDISVTRKSCVTKSPISRYCVWYLFFVSISMSVLYVFQKNEFSQRHSFDFDSVLLYLLETRRVQIVVTLRLTTWSTRSKYVHPEVRNHDWRRRFSSLAFFVIPSRVAARLFTILCSRLTSDDSYCVVRLTFFCTVVMYFVFGIKNGWREDK